MTGEQEEPVDDIYIRLSRPEDNDALVALSAACPMRAAMSLCVHRDPDFFTLSRLQGDPWVVFVAEDPQEGIIGCVGGAVRKLWLGGEERSVMFTGDFKLHPRFRGRGLADKLLAAGWPLCEELGVASMMGALAGNKPIERRVLNPPPGIPKPGTLGTASVYTLLLPGVPVGRSPQDITVQPATAADVDAMLELWAQVAPLREGAQVLDVTSFLEFVAAAPGLSLGDYLLARRGDQLVGWTGIWNQDSFKETRVLDFDIGVAIARRAHDLVARPLGWPLLPNRGDTLRALHAVHLCVPAAEPDALRALVMEARRRCVREGVPALELGLDPRDPLTSALRHLPKIRVDVRCYLSPEPGKREIPLAASRPIHFETALV